MNKNEEIASTSSKDISAIVLVISNLAIIVYGIIQQWNFTEYFLTFIIQSFIIGFFFFIKVIFYKNLYYKNYSKESNKIRVNLIGKIVGSIFVLIIFGFFNFLYLGFISAFLLRSLVSSTNPLSAPLIPAIIFFGNHLFSFIYNFKRDKDKEKDYLRVVYLFISRIAPIHITLILWGVLIIFGGFFTALFFGTGSNLSNLFAILNQAIAIVFLLIKTYWDYKTHNLEHKLN